MYDNDDWLDWYEDVDEGDREPGYALREYWLDEQADAYHDYMFDDMNEEYDND